MQYVHGLKLRLECRCTDQSKPKKVYLEISSTGQVRATADDTGDETILTIIPVNVREVAFYHELTGFFLGMDAEGKLMASVWLCLVSALFSLFSPILHWRRSLKKMCTTTIMLSTRHLNIPLEHRKRHVLAKKLRWIRRKSGTYQWNNYRSKVDFQSIDRFGAEKPRSPSLTVISCLTHWMYHIPH